MKKKTSKIKGKKPSKELIPFGLVPDTHRPHHDPLAERCALRAFEFLDIKILALLGDFVDCEAVSQHRHSPWDRLDLSEELLSGDEGLRQYEKLDLDRKVYIEGNHEERTGRALADELSGPRAQQLVHAGLIKGNTLPEIWDLKKRKWEWIPYKDYTKIGKLHLTHDTERAGQYAHYRAEEDFGHNAVIGHTHRFGYQIRSSITRECRLGAHLGWLGDFDTLSYRHKARARREWVHGFAYGYLDPETDCIFLFPVPIVKYQCVVGNGKLIKA